MSRVSRRRSVVLAAAVASLAACASHPPAAREIFDERTASTLTVVSAPIVFGRERTDVAALTHDFATLVAIEIDRSGRGEQYLLLYRWSTVDRPTAPPPDADAGALRLLADGRVIDLEPLERLPVSLDRAEALHVPAHVEIAAFAYRADPALLGDLAGSRELTLRLPHERVDVPFAVWEDGRAALARFAAGASP